MGSEQEFVDFYDILQVNPNCDARILEIAYHYFAKMYHPDNSETADPDKFNQLVEVYGVLRNAEKRAEYDRIYYTHKDNPEAPLPHFDPELDIDEKVALDDADMREKILLHLYKRRREHPADPGMIGWLLQEALECSDDEFEFHLWYLKAKKFVEITENSALAITIEGVDHIIQTSRASPAAQLLIDKPEANGHDTGFTPPPEPGS